ncbi:Endoplasmic reticulum transmembrane protein [Citrus sinensis]|nr:Endoplasmic reticulum transmembrane protein [Citrus sinensis]
MVITEPSTMGTRRSTGGDLKGCDSAIVWLEPVIVKWLDELGEEDGLLSLELYGRRGPRAFTMYNCHLSPEHATCAHRYLGLLRRSNRSMALEWVVLGYAAAAEAVMVLMLTLPGLDGIRRGLVAVTRNLLKPFLSVVPFCLFLLLDIYWKYETRPSCEGDSCSPTEHLRHQKSIMKSQRNALLIASALVFYWLLYSVTHLVVKIEQLNQRIERLKNKE